MEPLYWCQITDDSVPTEEELRREADRVRREFESVKAAYEKASQYARKVGLDRPEGVALLDLAVERYNQVLTQYRGSVKQLTDFVLNRLSQQ